MKRFLDVDLFPVVALVKKCRIPSILPWPSNVMARFSLAWYLTITLAVGVENPELSRALHLNRQAQEYYESERYADALPLVTEVLAIREKALGPEHPATALCLNDLANLYRALGNFAEAEKFFKRALNIEEKVLGPEDPTTAATLNNLAKLYHLMGNDAKAGPLREQLQAVQKKPMELEEMDIAVRLNELARHHKDMGNYAMAKQLDDRASNLRKKPLGSKNPEDIDSIQNRAFAEIDKQMPSDALKYAFHIEEVGEKMLADVLSSGSEQERGEFQKTQHPYTLPGTLGDASLMARTLLRWKGVVLDSLIEDHTVAHAARDVDFGGEFEAMISIRSELFKLTLEMQKDPSKAALLNRAEQKRKLGNELKAIEASLAKYVATRRQSRWALNVIPEQVQLALDPQEALVEFISYIQYLGENRWESRYGAVIFTANGGLKWVVLGAADEIDKTIHAYRVSVRREKNDAETHTILRKLYGDIWATIELVLPQNTNRVILSPDADLNFVSFATLLGHDEKFLAERYSLRYVSSGRDLLRAPKVTFSTAPTIVIYGNPDFLATETATESRSPRSVGPSVAMRDSEIHEFRNIKLGPIPGTETECRALENLAKDVGSTVWIEMGKNATKASLLRVQSPFVLHLATHGFFLPEMELGNVPPGIRPINEIPRGKLVNPMHRSGLAFSGAQRTLEAWGRGETPSANNNGILTAEEVGTLALEGTWLVTLSACDTGIGEARAGEGVLGLRRGFIQAGAQNLLLTLWPINDEATIKIMLDFYADALASGEAAESLIKVQRKWLVKLRREKGLWAAVNLAGPFIMSSQGKTDQNGMKKRH